MSEKQSNESDQRPLENFKRDKVAYVLRNKLKDNSDKASLNLAGRKLILIQKAFNLERRILKLERRK